MATDPWDQRDGEPAEAYARFLCYRNLGPGRSLVLAAQVHGGGTGKRKKTPDGHWGDESARHEWRARASAWDICQLRHYGESLTVEWVAVLSAAVRKAAQALADPDCVPRSFRESLAVIAAVAPYLSPEVLAALTCKEYAKEHKYSFAFPPEGGDRGEE